MQPKYLVAIVATGFLTDAYNVWVVDVLSSILAHTYSLPGSIAGVISGGFLAGTIIGMVLGGLAADVVGRRKVYLLAAAVLTVGCIGSLTASGASVVEQLAFWRSLVGLGVGAEYPLSAVYVAETVPPGLRGRYLAMTFLMQGVGRTVAALLLYILLVSGVNSDAVWRIGLAVGTLPYLVLLRIRWKLTETNRFADLDKENVPEALSIQAEPLSAVAGVGHDTAALNDIHAFVVPQSEHHTDTTALTSASAAQGNHPHKTVRERLSVIFVTLARFKTTLFGVCAAWFLLDIFFYGQGMWSSRMLEMIGFNESDQNASTALTTFSLSGFIIALIALPGYLLAVALIEIAGRKRLQTGGFAACSVCFFILGVGGQQLQQSRGGVPFVLLYAFTFLFANMGPNTTTFVFAAETIPTRGRATAHGLAAAAGKVGAIVGTAALPAIMAAFSDAPNGNTRGIALSMYVCSAVAAVGSLLTWAIMKETRQQPLERLEANEKQTAAVVEAPLSHEESPHEVVPELAVNRALAGEHARYALDV